MRIEGDTLIIPVFDPDDEDYKEEIMFDLCIPDQSKEAVEMLVNLIEEQVAVIDAMDTVDSMYIQVSKN